MTADISYVPPDVQRYTIHKSSGQNLAEMVVRKVLENESEVLLHPASTDISPSNYAFRFLKTDNVNGRRCYVLELRALRKSNHLILGKIWVDQATYLINRIEGQPARTPSWWVRDVRVRLDFHEVKGMWLQTDLCSTANVRLLGQHTLVSRDIEYRLGGIQAAKRPAGE